MSQRSLGLVACGLACALAGGIAVAVWFAARGAGGILPGGDVASASAVASHRYWKVKPSRAAVLAMAEKIREAKADMVVYIDDEGRMVIKDGHRISDPSNQRLAMGKPEEIGKRFFFIPMWRTFGVRPSAAEVLQVLKAHLDVAEFQS